MIRHTTRLMRRYLLVLALCAYVALLIYVQVSINRVHPPCRPQRLGITVNSDHYSLTVTGIAANEKTTAVLQPLPQRSETVAAFRYTWFYPSDMRITDNRLWLACGKSGVIAFDISNPARPKSLLALKLDDKAWKICVTGNVLYVATMKGVYAFDISDIDNPALKWHVMSDHHIVSLASENNILAVASRTSGIVLYATNQPGRPRRIGTITARKTATKLQLHDGILYYIDAKCLCRCDIGNPAQPLQPKFYPLNGLVVHSMAPYRNLLYLACGPKGLYSVEADRPKTPILRTEIPVHAISIVGNRLMASSFSRMVHLFDLHGNGDVKLLKRFLLRGRCGLLKLYGRYAIGLILRDGFSVVDTHSAGITDKNDIELKFGERRRARLATVAGTICLGWKNSLQLYRYTQNSGLSRLTSLKIPGFINDISHDKTTLYLSVRKHGIMRVNPATNNTRWQASTLTATTLPIHHIFASDNTLYLGVRNNGIFCVPTNLATAVPPRPLVPVDAKAISTSGRYIYALDQNKGLMIYSLHDGKAKLEHSLTYQKNLVKSQPRTIAVRDGFAFIPSETMGLISVDLNSGGAPEIADFINLPGFPSRVKVHGHYAYINDGVSNINVVDISDPRSLRFVCRLRNNWDVTICDNTLIGVNDAGLSVAPIPKPLPCRDDNGSVHIKLPQPDKATTAEIQISTGKLALRLTAAMEYTPTQGWRIIRHTSR